MRAFSSQDSSNSTVVYAKLDSVGSLHSPHAALLEQITDSLEARRTLATVRFSCVITLGLLLNVG